MIELDVDNPKIVLVDLKEFNDSVDNDTVYTDTDTDNDAENLHMTLVLKKSGMRVKDSSTAGIKNKPQYDTSKIEPRKNNSK